MSIKTSTYASVASLTRIKETLDNMLQVMQQELRNVDNEWTQMCAMVAEELQAKQDENSVVFEERVESGLLDDPSVVNETNLEL